jgi:hypothetical protein
MERDMNDKPYVICPAAHVVRKRVTDGVWTVVCGIIFQKTLERVQTYEHFEIVPSHCSPENYPENYCRCQVFREEKDAEWKRKYGKKYSSLAQGEKIVASW